jgi:hypothetical protein
MTTEGRAARPHAQHRGRLQPEVQLNAAAEWLEAGGTASTGGSWAMHLLEEST